MGNAERLINQFGEDIRYCNTTKSWFIWNSVAWEKDKEQKIMIYANKTVNSIQEEISQENEETIRQELTKWARRSAGHQYRKNMVQSAQPLVPMTATKWNADKSLFNCKNGTLELDTLSFREHRKQDYITKISGVIYDPSADCPTWENHLSLVFDNNQELIDAIQMICGYTLLADNPEQVFFILYGTGRNGKTVTQNVISKIFGDYATNVASDTLMVHCTPGGSPRSDIVRLDGARLITSSEGDAEDRLSEKLVKQMTGGDTITARGLYQDERELKINGKIWFATNHKPRIVGTDNAIWRRVWLIPFDITIPQEDRDPYIHEKLLAESSGILNWMIQGLRRYYKNGHKLIKPKGVQVATMQYKTESDIVGQFIDGYCIIDLDDLQCKVDKDSLWDAFTKWGNETGEVILSKKKFTQKLNELGIREDGGRRTKIGIRLKDNP
jgi:putative DNA primase/helicase